MRLHFITSMIVIGLIFSGCTGSGFDLEINGEINNRSVDGNVNGDINVEDNIQNNENVEYIIEKVDENGEVYYELNEEYFPKNIRGMTLDRFVYENSTVSITRDNFIEEKNQFSNGSEYFEIKYAFEDIEYSVVLIKNISEEINESINDLGKDAEYKFIVEDKHFYSVDGFAFFPKKNNFDFAYISSGSLYPSESSIIELTEEYTSIFGTIENRLFDQNADEVVELDNFEELKNYSQDTYDSISEDATINLAFANKVSMYDSGDNVVVSIARTTYPEDLNFTRFVFQGPNGLIITCDNFGDYTVNEGVTNAFQFLKKNDDECNGNFIEGKYDLVMIGDTSVEVNSIEYGSSSSGESSSGGYSNTTYETPSAPENESYLYELYSEDSTRFYMSFEEYKEIYNKLPSFLLGYDLNGVGSNPSYHIFFYEETETNNELTIFMGLKNRTSNRIEQFSEADYFLIEEDSNIGMNTYTSSIGLGTMISHSEYNSINLFMSNNNRGITSNDYENILVDAFRYFITYKFNYDENSTFELINKYSNTPIIEIENFNEINDLIESDFVVTNSSSSSGGGSSGSGGSSSEGGGESSSASGESFILEKNEEKEMVFFNKEYDFKLFQVKETDVTISLNDYIANINEDEEITLDGMKIELEEIVTSNRDSVNSYAEFDVSVEKDDINMSLEEQYNIQKLPSDDESREYTIQFVYLNTENNENNDSDYEFIKEIMKSFPKEFNEATLGLAEISAVEKVLEFDYDNGEFDVYEVKSKLKSDKFANEGVDFYAIYTDDNISHFNGIYNSPHRKEVVTLEEFNKNIDLYTTEKYESSDRSDLISVAYLGEIDGYVERDINASINGLLGMIGYNWCCNFGNNYGTDFSDIEINQQGTNFYRGLDSPYLRTTPMGSDNWQPNGDGSFSRYVNHENFFSLDNIYYHPITLYFMGLLPEERYDESFAIYNVGGANTGESFDFDNGEYHKNISIKEIHEIEGSRILLK